MPEMGEKKEKRPVPFRIQEETAEKIRALSKDFPNQDAAFNALMGAFERENLMMEQPQFAEDIKRFEQLQRMLSVKFTDILNALSSANERARAEVQNLLSSKDVTIQGLQELVAGLKAEKEKNDLLYQECLSGKRVLEEELSKEKLVNEGLSAQIKEKELQYASSLADKERLNDILTKSVEEKQAEVARLLSYAEEMESCKKKIDSLSAEKKGLEQQLKDAQYNEQKILLEREKEFEKEKAVLRREMEDKAQKQQERSEKEIERLREMLSQVQEQLLGIGAKGPGKK